MLQEEISAFLLTQGFSPQYEGFRNLNQTLQYTLENPCVDSSILSWRSMRQLPRRQAQRRNALSTISGI